MTPVAEKRQLSRLIRGDKERTYFNEESGNHGNRKFEHDDTQSDIFRITLKDGCEDPGAEVHYWRNTA